MSRFDTFSEAEALSGALAREQAKATQDGAALDLFRRWTTPELLEADLSFRWHVRRLIIDPTHGMWAGEMKTLKTTVSTVVNLARAAGVPAFGVFEVDEPAPVMSYVGEGGRVPYTRLLKRLARAMDIDLAAIPFEVSFQAAPMSGSRFIETLDRDLREVKPALVVPDPLYAFHGTAADARNLHDEGGLLAGLSTRCADAGASTTVVNHFNQTGAGRGLKRITMAGGGEWCDSWWLLSHREEPDVGRGEFRLLLEVGSRQWGGSAWDLDVSLGAFNHDLEDFDGDVSWAIRRHDGASDGGGGRSVAERVLDHIGGHPLQESREDVARSVGGNLVANRQAIDDLVASGALKTMKVHRKRANGRPYPVWAYQCASEGQTSIEEIEEF